MANALLDNPSTSPALEMTLLGGEFQAEIALAIAIAGAPMEATVESVNEGSRTLLLPQSLSLEAGDRLILGPTYQGARTYLAVKGGWQGPVVLRSQASDRPAKAGDRLLAEPWSTPSHRPIESGFLDPESEPIRVVDGPEAIDGNWESASYRVSARSDRIGIRLDGPTIDYKSDPGRLSTPVSFGTVQLAGGQLLILGPSGGTMGGYPNVAQVISADLSRLGQARPGTCVKFRRVSIAEARSLDQDQRNRLADRILRMTSRVRGTQVRLTARRT